MPSALPVLSWRGSRVTVLLVAALSAFGGEVSAQQPQPLHLNPAIEKLAKGQPIIGGQT